MFNTEFELVEFFVNKQSRKKNRKIITELTTNYGRPDIVELVYSEKILNYRRSKLTNSVKIGLERVDSYILTFLYGKGWINIETIIENMCMAKLALNRALERLKFRSLISIKDGKIKLNGKSEVLAIKQINVYEAKLSNWKYDIEQAERHLWFSNNSSILIPEPSMRIFDNCLSVCKEREIGFIVSNGKKTQTIHDQNSKTLINTPLLWELNEKLIDGSL